jgi:hypothetical protein
MQSVLRFSAAAAAFAALVILGGCSTASKDTTITYSFEPRFSFPEAKTYQWRTSMPTYRKDSLVEANVRFVADRELAAKGLTLQTDKADLIVWMAYEFDPQNYSYGRELRALSINVSRTSDNELVWRGLATGTIRTDAASEELKKSVQGILVNFPPARAAATSK